MPLAEVESRIAALLGYSEPSVLTRSCGKRASTGGTAAVKGGKDLLPDDKKAAVNAAFSDADSANLKFFANIPPGVEDMEGKALEKIKAATGG